MKKYIVYIQSKSTNFDDVQYLIYIKKIKWTGLWNITSSILFFKSFCDEFF